MGNTKLTLFTVEGSPEPIRFVETQAIKEGVECDIYIFSGNKSKDLAIVRVAQGYATPLQRVLRGDKTIEGLYDGTGTLIVHSGNGQTDQYTFDVSHSEPVVVKVGQVMQWHANGNSDLTLYEICEPPYADGRFENIE